MKKYFFLEKKQYLSLGIVLLFCCALYFLFQKSEEEPPTKVSFVATETTPKNVTIVEFNPNDLDEKQWENLGFTPRQVTTILKYKKVVGGYFSSKAQLKKCYAINDEKYHQLEPYILLPEHAQNYPSEEKYRQNKTSHQRDIRVSKPFDPNAFSEQDWQSIGFSQKQAAAIVKYKYVLGGRFSSKEKLKDCFVISAENYQKIEPYLLFPEKSEETPKTSKTKHYTLSNFDPNMLDEEGWQQLGFSEKQAQSILKYKQKYLNGSFRTLEDVQKNYIIADRWEELKPYVKLNEQTILPPIKPEITTANPELKVDISTLELNSIKVKELIALGFSEKNAVSIVGFRKALGGFVNKEQVFETYGIDREKAEILVKNIRLNTDDVPKYTLIDAPESWLKTHPYFKYVADKIIFYRLSFPNERKIWKFIKTSPEKEAKMKLYLIPAK